MAPGIASGGDTEEADARDEAPITPRQVAARYLEAGLDGESDRAQAALCDDATPQVLEADLIELRAEYEEELGSYPEVEVGTDEPVNSDSGMEVGSTISFIGETVVRDEFTVTVLATGSSYCVVEVDRNSELADEETSSTPESIEPRSLAAEFLSSILAERDLDAATALQCEGYTGIVPRELIDAVVAWESSHGVASVDQSTGNAMAGTGSNWTVPIEANLVSGFNETFGFEVGIDADLGCVSSLEGGEGLVGEE
ncbi:hypothetical protein [Glycomyces xiaoerkulensis]|uniref:hypothetical protein n=1 Tax=Glycomyces xiaoerkulensis TaxID=2038139 RepID=UPI0013000F18|nr:hypothetical protein [Glycomyces xiaoerkulensis]